MEDLKVRKLREKLGISVEDQQEAAGKAISPNLQKKISGFAGAGGNFISAPPGPDSAVAESRTGAGGNFISAPPVPD